jgi:hypothetical protein
MEEHKLIVFENRALRRIFGSRETRGQGTGRYCIIMSCRECCTSEEEERCIQGFGAET